ncbi:hypothetical protein RDE2_35610 [Rhodococcus sp. RDE2]|nr:hypothetical protein RDE2_35610 [Rhodococcus sp. RDE2]
MVDSTDGQQVHQRAGLGRLPSLHNEQTIGLARREDFEIADDCRFIANDTGKNSSKTLGEAGDRAGIEQVCGVLENSIEALRYACTIDSLGQGQLEIEL